MAIRGWSVYVGIFILAALIDGIGQSVLQFFTGTDDLNNATGFQVDKISTGSGFEGLPRANPNFFVVTAPKFVTWDFGFLTGDAQFLQLIMIAYFGVLFVVNVTSGIRALLQRNV